ncbi:uncharacterized protein LOC124146019 isoform X2 [Haliotis rufescens]|uniref:uncharacterized protein LOC124146019 isoform X2 n=1 Tax=Haliotis rufescens TaxID=6454 RepID=UPI00201F2539|nr:uncharacterized protein LOC124146019 isoform X2 [Haliotis rufescens]
MEDEEEDIHSLLHLRKHRTAFVRMVSWEIGNKAQRLPKRKKSEVVMGKTGNTDSGTDSDSVKLDESETSDIDAEVECDSESNEGEYSSAEETTDTVINELVASNKTKEEIRMEVLLDESDLQVHEPETQHYRAPNKRQKRKKRARRREDMESAIPFRNVEILDFDCLNLDSEVEVTVQRKIPSLVEICMKTLWEFNLVRTGSTNVSQKPDIPAGMQHELFMWRSSQHTATAQLKWLYRLLGQGEESLQTNSYYMLEEVTDEEGAGLRQSVLQRATRTVWNCKVLGYEESQNFMEYSGTEASDWLPYSYMNNTEIGPLLNHVSYWWKFPTSLLSGLSSVLDLMLPQQNTAMTKSCKSTKSTNYAKSIISPMSTRNKSMATPLSLIGKSLSQRYPLVVKYVFQEAVPYTLWARGDVDLALQHFHSLAKQASGYRRAMYLSEGARLCAFVGETEMARDFYKESADAVIGRIKGGNQDEQEVITQRSLLMTNLGDQGPMTEEKAEMASASWRATLQHTTTAPHTTSLRAVESHFCFHSGTNRRRDVSTLSHLKEGLCWIKSLQGCCPMLTLHQAVVEAWLGWPTDADTTLRHIGTRAMWLCEKQVNIFELAKVKAVCAQPLKVVWRTQLGHMRLVSGQQCYEADFIAQTNLHLHLTTDGFLSGDLQMVLPPIRALNLDPYTGVHVFKTLSTVPQPWHSLNSCSVLLEAFNYNGGFIAPTFVQLYENESGDTVQLASKTIAMNGIPLHDFTFFWTAANGNRTKLNLFSRLRKSVRDEKVSYFESTRDPDITQFVEGNEEWVSGMTQSIHYCYNKAFTMGGNALCYVKHSLKKIKKFETALKKSRNKKALLKLEGAKTKLREMQCDKFGLEIVEYFVYGETLFLLLMCDECTGIKVVFDCSNLEAFMDPKIQVIVKTGREYIQGETISRQRSNCIAHGRVMWLVLESARNNRLLHVYGQGGRLLTEKQLLTGEEMQTPLVHGTMLYGIAPDRHSVLCDQLTGGDPIRGCVVDWDIVDLLVLPSVLLVHSEIGLHILCPSSLQLKCITVTTNTHSLSLSSDQRTIEAPNLSTVQIIGERVLPGTGDGSKQYGTAVAADNHLLLFQGREAEVGVCIAVPGHAKEFCWVNRDVGFLVSVSLQDPSQVNYRETLYHYNYRGELLAVLPFLGPGPRNMFPALLPGTREAAAHDPLLGKPGWYVFLRDGHEGIMGTRLCDM